VIAIQLYIVLSTAKGYRRIVKKYKILRLKHRLLINAILKIEKFLLLHRQVFEMLETREQYLSILSSITEFTDEAKKEVKKEKKKKQR